MCLGKLLKFTSCKIKLTIDGDDRVIYNNNTSGCRKNTESRYRSGLLSIVSLFQSLFYVFVRGKIKNKKEMLKMCGFYSCFSFQN